ncbi:MAG: hypothetical protein ACRDRL_22630, partial [Sciscionella sp.]
GGGHIRRGGGRVGHTRSGGFRELRGAHTDGGTWTARPRFRFAVAALVEDSDLYALVNDLTTDPVDLDGVDS